ncbi:sulfite exporter TauE/SafE family protein [Bacillus smithii]|uniref:Urease accessory protein ureH n=1 Tax=Bacillus smithii 7_3_47FAA TaxID=665952 RepID=G9QNI4_9BACI|nr:sulfite exporter TauE/SafE family protein [Bacillus smithii]EHL75913.1 urease accessory protein ureH [Bacillus smithii 7_3_47FAA]MED0659799.1 sulfite exporter TauE/SafE family protein [Bacillus smithii]
MDQVDLLSVLTLGFVLGIKHAMEPDHVIAVSTIVCQSKKLWRSSLAGVFWGIGHTSTLLIFGMTIILMKKKISQEWSMSLEFLVGIILVYFGISAILSLKKTHEHSHSRLHLHTDHPIYTYKGIPYVKSLFIGIIHGLAGSAAMVLLTMSTVEKAWEGLLYILFFGAGTVLGMLCFTTLIGIPFTLSARKIRIHNAFIQITGFISTVFGIHYMYNLGVTEGLFKLWIR